MIAERKVLLSLNKEDRATLEQKLSSRQSGKCFICEDIVDLVLHHGQLDIDHIIPLSEGGPDEENNFALTHASCNRAKGATDLRVARRMAQFERLQEAAREKGERGANLGHLLKNYGGAKAQLTLRKNGHSIEFSLPEADDISIHSCPLYRDPLRIGDGLVLMH